MERIVITGATGFLGSHLAGAFLRRGAEVFALVRPESHHLEALPVHKHLHIVRCGLSNVLDCVGKIGSADGFFHFAWGGVNREDIDSPAVQASNVAGSLACIEAAHLLNCRIFMDAGSRVEYGVIDGIMSEDRECRPVNQYGMAKLEFYQKAGPLCKKLGILYYHLRFFSVYGYGDHPWSMISTLVRDLRKDEVISLSACLHLWNFMYIEDAVDAVCELYRYGTSQEAGDRIVNIASRDTRPLRDFAEEVKGIIGGDGCLEYGTFVQANEGALSVRPSICMLEDLTKGNWKECYTFRQGINEMIKH